MRPKLNFVLIVLAVVAVFFVIDTLTHHPLAAAWPKALAAIAISALCLLITRERESLDLFLMVIAALLTLFAVASSTALPGHARAWLIFGASVAFAAIAVLLTRKKREALLAIVAIVGFRLIWGGIMLTR